MLRRLRRPRRPLATALTITAAAASLALAACGDDDDDADDGADGGTAATAGAPATSAADDGADAPATTAAGTTSGAAGGPVTVPVVEEAAACAEGNTISPGTLTVATGEPAFPPYVIDDAPESGQGFEAAVAYAVASAMGFAPEDVTWVRTTFDAAIQPGPKEFDFNLQQYTITEERAQVVSFSQPYYAGNQAILGYADSPAADAESISDFQDLRIGVATGTTSLTFVTDVLQPTSDPLVYNDNAGAKAALDAQQIDAIVADLPTALYIRDVEIEGSEVFGQFPASEGTEGDPWGLLFEQDNPLVECANLALTELETSGVLDDITTEWMSLDAGVPEINLE